MVGGMSEKKTGRTGGDLQRQGGLMGIAGVLIFLFGRTLPNATLVVFLGAALAVIGLVMWGAGLVRGDD